MPRQLAKNRNFTNNAILAIAGQLPVYYIWLRILNSACLDDSSHLHITALRRDSGAGLLLVSPGAQAR